MSSVILNLLFNDKYAQTFEDDLGLWELVGIFHQLLTTQFIA